MGCFDLPELDERFQVLFTGSGQLFASTGIRTTLGEENNNNENEI